MKKIITAFCRIILGATFIFSGMMKAIDPVGGALKQNDYFGAFNLSAFNDIAFFTSINLSAIEFVMGVSILLAVYRRWTTLIILLFMSFMTLLTLYLAIFNPVHDCGCFGDALIITNWQTFFKNALILLPAAVVTFVWKRKMTPFYSKHTRLFVPVFAYVFIMCFQYWNYYNLPVVDFRPYKIGAHIPTQMTIPDDAPRDEVEFVYTKNGRDKQFKMSELEEADSTWTFKEQKIVKRGFVPPIISFELYDNKDNNIADLLLEDGAKVFLLVAPYLDKASDKTIDEINYIYDYTREHDIKFYCVTSSAPEWITVWVKTTGAEYPFLTADDVTLKTMIRSNPGLVLLKSGTVLKKWHYLNIPSQETAIADIEQLINSTDPPPPPNNKVWLWIILIFAVPFLLVKLQTACRVKTTARVRGTVIP
ncbi:MAG: DoxX family protein [Tannerella sp.]|jgi:uncharacterized membrane protein YphA (DoxX/SURF4 family)|nr:DoxX family protein [Tannerella sp.]